MFFFFLTNWSLGLCRVGKRWSLVTKLMNFYYLFLIFFSWAISVILTTSILTPTLSSDSDDGPLEATEKENGLIPSPLKLYFLLQYNYVDIALYLKVAFKLSNPEASILKPSLPKFCFPSLVRQNNMSVDRRKK